AHSGEIGGRAPEVARVLAGGEAEPAVPRHGFLPLAPRVRPHAHRNGLPAEEEARAGGLFAQALIGIVSRWRRRRERGASSRKRSSEWSPAHRTLPFTLSTKARNSSRPAAKSSGDAT